ncbi:DinB family protein [Candidatus Korobacter versatilis]|nr:DinB family protein [Candidatus Koribacter versatilis]
MIGRPQESEAALYYWKYINLVPGDDPQAVMDHQVEEVDAVFTAISDERSLHRYEPGKWTIRQMLNHVTDTERAFVFRALWFARGFEAPLPSYDQEISAAGANANSIPWHDHIDELRNVRLATLSFFRNLPQDAWTRSGIASDNRFTVRALAYIIPGHVAHHLKILRERYLK